MRIGSLFSGAGGLDMAVEQVFGGEVIWQSELDKAASKVLEYRFPCAPNLGDITAIDWAAVEPVDVLCGGFPCQDVSAAGKRAGIKDGTQSGLWAIFADAIDALRPRYVVIENVRGLLSATAHRAVESDDAVVGDRSDRPVLRALGAVLGDLADIGYDAQWVTYAAGDVGAPHRRERVFILAADTENGRKAHQQEGRDDVAQQIWPVNRSSIGNSKGNSSTGIHLMGGVTAGLATGVDLLPTPTTQDGANNGGPSQFQRNSLPLNAVAALLPTPAASDCTGGGSHPDSRVGHSRQLIDYALLDGTERWGKYAAAIARWEQIAGPAPAPTQPNRNGKPCLNPAFSEWMMGWPFGWVTDPDIGISRNDQLKIVGNGVCPQQAVAALRYLLAVASGDIGSSGAGRTSPPVELLPTPCVVDRLATGEMTLEEWDESRRSQKERSVGSFGPRGDSLGAAILRVEEGTADDRPDFSTTKSRRSRNGDALPGVDA